MENVIVNGYLVVWAIVSLTIWIPSAFLVFEATDKNRPNLRLFKVLATVNIIVVTIDLLTAPLQVALIQELWRG